MSSRAARLSLTVKRFVPESDMRAAASALNPSVWLGESVRWYLKHARHPFKNYIVGHYWSAFAKPRLWVRYQAGMIIGVRIGDYLQQRIFFDGVYEQSIVTWLKTELRPDDVFWDVGANIGAISLIASQLCHQVVAFEPDPRSLECLRNNVDCNRITNIQIVAQALSDRNGVATLHQASTRNTGMTSLLSGHSEPVGTASVEVVRGDDFAAAHSELSPTVMKIDVEGGEHLVLAGAVRLLAAGRIRTLIFEDRCGPDSRPSNQAVVNALQAAGYHIESFGRSEEHIADGFGNFIATPDQQVA